MGSVGSRSRKNGCWDDLVFSGDVLKTVDEISRPQPRGHEGRNGKGADDRRDWRSRDGFCLGSRLRYAGATSAAQGAAVGFFNWLGVVAVVTLTIAVYEKRPFKLFVINNGYQLVSMLIMGAILAVWRP